MRCRTVQERLNASLDGLLQPSERAAMEVHLQGCPECQAALARLRRLSSLLEGIPSPPVPDGFSERLMARAYQRQAERCRSRILSWRPVLFWRGMPASMRVAAAAVLVIGFAIGALMGRGTSRTIAAAPQETGQVSMADTLGSYNLDYLSEAPRGSLADAYLTLASAANGGGR